MLIPVQRVPPENTLTAYMSKRYPEDILWIFLLPQDIFWMFFQIDIDQLLQRLKKKDVMLIGL